MKIRKFCLLVSSLIIFTPTITMAQMTIRNGNTVVETDGNGRVRIFKDKGRTNIYHQNRRAYPYYQWLRENDDFEYAHPRKNCYQYHRQTVSNHSSNRRVTQNSVSHCK